MQRAVFLDRDGVLTRLVRRGGRRLSPRTLGEFAVLPTARPAVRALRRAGWLVIVVTNQPDVARGALAPETLERMHHRLRRAVPVDAIYACPHDDADGCDCRKPKPGLLRQASSEWGIGLRASFLVGDSWKDIAAGRAAGCSTILVGEAECPPDVRPSFVLKNLAAAAELIQTGVGFIRGKKNCAPRSAGTRGRERARRTRGGGHGKGR